FSPSADGRVNNTLRAAGPGVDAHYHKIHLFDAFGFRESETVAPGTEPVVITVGGVNVGLTLCYDVRFPGLYTRLAELGAQVICVAASWGAGPGKVEQWQLLTRARALDCTSYLVAAAQADPAAAGSGSRAGGLDGSAPTGVGYSAVISPRGEVLQSLGAEPGLLVADLDLDVVEHTRAAIPVLANRRI
ncbi:MAG TPA: nitrilase-related carbon-nitrogen hydrolase, partial [Propionibacteriaceae bacterium]|nr:nitrilase-related carbon-nitrogen hydrolase [Propionibacteriaceae bacterium]